MAVAVATIHSISEGCDIDGCWVDVVGNCKLTHDVVRRRLFDDGTVAQAAGKSWVPLDMRDKAEFINTLRDVRRA